MPQMAFQFFYFSKDETLIAQVYKKSTISTGIFHENDEQMKNKNHDPVRIAYESAVNIEFPRRAIICRFRD